MLNPRRTTTYTLNAANVYGTVTASVTVTVVAGDATDNSRSSRGATGIAAAGTVSFATARLWRRHGPVEASRSLPEPGHAVKPGRGS